MSTRLRVRWSSVISLVCPCMALGRLLSPYPSYVVEGNNALLCNSGATELSSLIFVRHSDATLEKTMKE